MYRNIFGSDNSVLAESAPALTVNPGTGSQSTGTVSVTPCHFIFDGRVGELSGSSTATYNRPTSTGLQTLVEVCIMYAKDASGVESFTLVTCQSEIAANVAGLPVLYDGSNVPNEAIGDNPANNYKAYFPLFRFVASATSYSNVQSLYKTVDSIPTLRNAITAETNARLSQDTTLSNAINATDARVTAEETARKTALLSEESARKAKDSDLDTKYNNAMTLLAKKAFNPELPSRYYNTNTQGVMYGYKMYFGVAKIKVDGTSVQTPFFFVYDKTLDTQKKTCCFEVSGETVFVTLTFRSTNLSGNHHMISASGYKLRKNSLAEKFDKVSVSTTIDNETVIYGMVPIA